MTPQVLKASVINYHFILFHISESTQDSWQTLIESLDVDRLVSAARADGYALHFSSKQKLMQALLRHYYGQSQRAISQ